MPPPEAPQGPLDQFLQPQSMVTPGALGAIAMVGTNAISGSFPYMNLPFTALLLSGLFGLAAIVKSVSVPERVLYYLLNSVIIFSVATGSNKLGQQVQQQAWLSLPSLAAYAAPNFNMDAWAPSPEKAQFFKEWFTTSPRPSPSTSSPSTSSPPTSSPPTSSPPTSSPPTSSPPTSSPPTSSPPTPGRSPTQP
jgi:hypothetical protein